MKQKSTKNHQVLSTYELKRAICIPLNRFRDLQTKSMYTINALCTEILLRYVTFMGEI